jgi:uncharacterized protein with HEPN domain
MAKRSARIRVEDIIDAIEGCRDVLDNRDFGAYSKSFVTRKAVERCVEIISEASKHIPDEIKAQHPTTPWRSIQHIGYVLRHEYSRVDDLVVWRVATMALPELKSVMDAILAQLSDDDA